MKNLPDLVAGTPLPAEVKTDLTHGNSPFSAEDRVVVALAYILADGNSAEAARISQVEKISDNIIRQWKRRSWWPTAMECARGLLNKELDSKYTQMLHMTVDELFDRVQHGDTVLDKNGEERRVPVKATDLVRIHGELSDKRGLLRGDGTGPTKKTDPIAVAIELAKLLHNQGKQQGVTIEGEVIRHALEYDESDSECEDGGRDSLV